MYGGAGDLFVMLCARYLAYQGKRVLVIDASADRRVLGHLPLPEEPLDCLFYQGVDYRIREVNLPSQYDIVLYYWGESAAGMEMWGQMSVVVSDCSRDQLCWAAKWSRRTRAYLVVTEVPEAGFLKRILRKMDVNLPETQVAELPWKSRDVQVMLAQEHGLRMSVRKLSRELLRVLRYLSEEKCREVEPDACGLLE